MVRTFSTISCTRWQLLERLTRHTFDLSSHCPNYSPAVRLSRLCPLQQQQICRYLFLSFLACRLCQQHHAANWSSSRGDWRHGFLLFGSWEAILEGGHVCPHHARNFGLCRDILGVYA